MTRATPFRLTVISGPNAGASALLPAGASSIGGGSTDNVVLDGIAPGALRVVLDNQRLRMQAATPGLALTGTGADRPLAPGQAHIDALPATLRLGPDTVVTLSRAKPQTGSQIALRHGVVMAGLALAAGLAVGLQLPPGSASLTGFQALAARPDIAPLNAASHNAAAPAAVTSPAKTGLPPAATVGLHSTSPRLTACTGACRQAAADSLRQRLEQAGLDGLTITPGDGVLRVSGDLPAAKGALWHDLRHRFETDFGTSLPLIVDITQGPDAPVLTVASVWLGPQPELRTKTGQTLRTGDRTGDGWTITRIAPGRIALQREQRQVEIRF